MSNANFSGSDMRDADLGGAIMHRTRDQAVNWKGANRKKAQTTDPDLAEAEDWMPPGRSSKS